MVMYLMPLKCTLKMIRMVNFMICILITIIKTGSRPVHTNLTKKCLIHAFQLCNESLRMF